MSENQMSEKEPAALELENRGRALLTRAEDLPEALAARAGHREPRFTGR
jgi:hypothetical protein